MTLTETLAAFGDEPYIQVRTRTGAEYDLHRDQVDNCDDSSDFVYGERINGTALRGVYGRIGRGTMNGSIRWFHLKNVTLIKDST